MMKSAPTESKAARAARLAEEAKVEQERVRAEGNRIDDTQSLLDADTLRRVRRFGQSPGTSLFGGAGGTGAPGGAGMGDLNIANMIAKSLFSGGTPGGLASVGRSGRSSGLAAIV